jgi:hypothetical protein
VERNSIAVHVPQRHAHQPLCAQQLQPDELFEQGAQLPRRQARTLLGGRAPHAEIENESAASW